MRSNGQSGRIAVIAGDGTRIGCEGLMHALKHYSREISVRACAVSCRELVDHAKECEPNVVVIGSDLEDGPGSGIVALRQLHKELPGARCIVLIDGHAGHLAVDAFCSGAQGVVSRREGLSVLAACIRKIHEGEMWAGTDALRHMVSALNTAVPVRAVSANGYHLLTARQKQIVALVAEGFSNREISERLTLSEHTVKNYLFRIFDKLGVSNRAELIIYTLHKQG